MGVRSGVEHNSVFLILPGLLQAINQGTLTVFLIYFPAQKPGPGWTQTSGDQIREIIY
jgi:hypothetical protein